MARPVSPSTRQETLLAAQRELASELTRLKREEEYLTGKVRQAREQVRYYEGMLELLRRDFGRNTGLADLVRKLG